VTTPTKAAISLVSLPLLVSARWEKSEAPCDSPLERGGGVCPCASLTHPCNHTVCAPPLKRGISIDKKNLQNTNKDEACLALVGVVTNKHDVFVVNNVRYE